MRIDRPGGAFHAARRAAGLQYCGRCRCYDTQQLGTRGRGTRQHRLTRPITGETSFLDTARCCSLPARRTCRCGALSRSPSRCEERAARGAGGLSSSASWSGWAEDPSTPPLCEDAAWAVHGRGPYRTALAPETGGAADLRSRSDSTQLSLQLGARLLRPRRPLRWQHAPTTRR